MIIGQSAFIGCSSLTSISIPDGVTTIGLSAFSGCSSLTSISLSDSVTTIGGNAFSGCSSLTSITIPSSVTTIGNYAFDCCSGLTSISIPDSVTEIGDWAFDDCDNLTDVFFGGSETEWNAISIGYNNSALTNATIHYNSAAPEDTTKDTDGDGLPDSWEIYGVDTDGDGIPDLRLDLMGADPEVPDIFVEVDWMVQPSKKFLWITTQEEISLAPSEESMRIVYQSFKDHGINLHIDAGPDSVDFVSGKSWGELSGGNEIPYEKNFSLGSAYEHWNEVVEDNFALNRWNIFRHCMFINMYNNETSSGIASGIPAQCFIVANQSWVRDTGDIGIAGTFMHELGHTLGLGHGGCYNDGSVCDYNYKPNYLSIMNYAFQTSGLVGTSEINYSDYTLPDLYEESLDERRGIDPDGVTAGTGIGTKLTVKLDWGWFKEVGPIAGSSIDFNGLWGIEDNPVSNDLNHDGEMTVLIGTNDWEHIIYKAGYIGQSIYNSAGLDFSAPISDTEEPMDELTFEEALEKGVLANKGTGALEAIGPYSLSTGNIDQSVYVRIKNMAPEQAAFKVHVDKSSLCEELNMDVTLEPSLDEISYIDIPIPIINAYKDGEYAIKIILDYEGEIVSELELPVELHTLDKEDIAALEDLINDIGDELPDVVKNEYIEIYEVYENFTFIYGDANADNLITAMDSASVLQKVLDASFVTGIESMGGDYMTYLDVNADGMLTASDASYILQKTLDNSFKMPCEE